MSEATEAKKYNPFDELEGEIESLPQMRAKADPQPVEAAPANDDGITKQDAAGRDIAIKRMRGTDKTVHQFTMRVAVRSSNRFAAWCDKHRLSYREGFDLLVPFLDNIDLSKR